MPTRPTWDDTVEEAPSWDDTMEDAPLWDDTTEDQPQIGDLIQPAENASLLGVPNAPRITLTPPSVGSLPPEGAGAESFQDPSWKEILMTPLTESGNLGRAAIADVAAGMRGSPEFSGNLPASIMGESLPIDKALADASSESPAWATVGKISQGLASSLPTIAMFPQGAIGKLVAAGFTADMLANAPDAARRLGSEMGKPEAERDMDAMTSAISELAQTAAFAPMAGAHAGGKFIGERVAPKAEAIRALAKELKAEPNVQAPTSREGLRQLGLRPPNLENVLGTPDLQALADRALQEGRNPVLDRGQTPAIEQIRRELNPPEVGLSEPTRLAERIEGGGEAPYGKTSFMREGEAPTTPRTQAARAAEPEGSLKLGEAKPSADSILQMSPESYFDTSRKWASDAMAGKGEPVQVQAEIAALREPNLAKWKEGYAKAAQEAAKVKAEIQANPASMSDPVVQKRFGGAAQKAQFFSEGIKVLEGTEPQARTRAALEREQALSAGDASKIPDDAPYEVFDTQTGQVVSEGVYKNRSRIRIGAETRNQNYGAFRYSTRVKPEWMEARRQAIEQGLKVKTTEIAQPISLKDTAAEVSRFEQEFPGAPKINIAPDFTAMPKTAQDLALSVGSDPRLIEAYVRNGEVWLNGDAVTSPAMVRRLALHETGGHWAVDKKLGSRLQKFMEQAHDSWADSETMANIRERYPNADKITLGRELIANLAENPMLAPKVWNRIVAQFRQWLRDIGWVKKVSENDIQSLITGAIDGMRKAEKGEATGEGMLSLKSAAEKANERFTEKLDTTKDPVQREAQSSKWSLGEVLQNKPGVAGYGGQAAPSSSNLPPGRVPPVASGAAPGSGRPTPQVSLDDIYKIFEPEKKTSPTLKERGVKIAEAFRTGVSSKFRPVNKLAEDIAKAYGLSKPKDIAGIMEQLKGSQGKGEADVYRFDRDVAKLVEGNEKDFNAYMFLQRTLDRLNQDAADVAAGLPARRKVSQYTTADIGAKIRALEQKLGPEKLRSIENAGREYQRYMDNALRLQVESGRMSPEVYNEIKSGNQFYAPFKVMKYLEESSKPEGSGRRIDTTADFTNAMEGIESPDFKLGDMLGAARQGILMSRILADKNVAMRNVAELAAFDTQGKFIKRLAADQEPAKGFEAVNVFENGKQNRYAVNKDVAEAVQLYGGNAGGVISRFLGYSSIPFRAGATAFNIPFQAGNLLIADAPRAALISKYGLRGASDLVRYPLDFVHALLSSIGGNSFGHKSKIYLDFLDSGVAGGTVQEALTPNALKFKEPTTISKSKKLARTVFNILPDFAKAIEETNKILGVKRAIRFENAQSGAQLARQIPEAITELRRFSGSPDFGRQGKTVEALRLNLIYMFLNARLQGAIADVGRLTGHDGANTAVSTWLKIAPAVGIPTALLYYLNNRPGYKEDYDSRPEQEKRNYWLIPKDSTITNDDGETMRDYWRIPKREVSKWFANFIETALGFAQKRDPKAAADFGVSMLEELSPVNIQGDTAQERLESIGASLNPLLKAPLELGSGRDLYRHRSIVPESMKDASPEQQYTPRTSEAFKKMAQAMPQVAPEFLRSPLVLENLTRNLSAGLFTQFLPRKPIEGRSKLENNPLLARFQALPYTDNTEIQNKIDDLRRTAADEQLERHRAALKLLLDNKGQKLEKILEKAPLDERLFNHVIDLYIAKENGITAKESQLLALPVKQRASFISNQIKDLPPEKQQEMLLDFSRKRILTEAVFQEMPDVMP